MEKVKQHEKEVEKLQDLYRELEKMIADTGNQSLMDKYIECLDQRNVCNQGFSEIIEGIRVEETEVAPPSIDGSTIISK